MIFKFLLLIPIKTYWLLVPKSKRRCCIFQESCSKYVFRITKEDGLINGLKAFKQRYKSCRAGYSFMLRDGKVSVHLANGDLVKIAEASSHLQKLAWVLIGVKHRSLVTIVENIKEINLFD